MATLRFHIVPNARQNKVAGEHGSAIKIKLCAPAVEGRAHAALRTFVANVLKIPERMIALERGHKSPDKLIRIGGLNDEEVARSPAALIIYFVSFAASSAILSAAPSINEWGS